jgi:hypothetical protein
MDRNPDVPDRIREIQIAYILEISGRYGAYLWVGLKICEKRPTGRKMANKTPG